MAMGNRGDLLGLLVWGIVATLRPYSSLAGSKENDHSVEWSDYGGRVLSRPPLYRPLSNREVRASDRIAHGGNEVSIARWLCPPRLLLRRVVDSSEGRF